MEQQHFITTSTLARMSEESVDMVRYAIRLGRLTPAARTDAGAALFTRDQAEAWVATRKGKRFSKVAEAL